MFGTSLLFGGLSKPFIELSIGDFVDNSIIYYVDPLDNTRGIGLALTDAGSVRFAGTTNINDTSNSHLEFNNNTNYLISVLGTSTSNAVGLARAYGDGTWDLPSGYFMTSNYDLINTALVNNGGTALSTGWYWTSTFYAQYDSVRETRPRYGQSELGAVNTVNLVRPVRAVGNW